MHSDGLAIQRSRPSVDYDGDDCDGEYCIGADDNREDDLEIHHLANTGYNVDQILVHRHRYSC